MSFFAHCMALLQDAKKRPLAAFLKGGKARLKVKPIIFISLEFWPLLLQNWIDLWGAFHHSIRFPPLNLWENPNFPLFLRFNSHGHRHCYFSNYWVLVES